MCIGKMRPVSQHHRTEKTGRKSWQMYVEDAAGSRVTASRHTVMVENVAGTLCHESHDLSHVISLSKDAGTNCRKKAILRVTGTKCREDAEV